MPTVITDLGSNSVPVAAFAGVVSTNVPLLLLGTDSGLVGTLDEGTGVTCTVTQGTNTVVLTMADGTGARASGGFLDLFAQFPLPMPTGFVQGNPADTIVWTGSTGGVPFAFSQAGTIASPLPVDLVPDEYGGYAVTQGETHFSLPFQVGYPLRASSALDVSSAVLRILPALRGYPFLPDPAAAWNGRALDLRGLNETPPVVRLLFDPAWGSVQLPPGPWRADALVTHSSGLTDYLPRGGILLTVSPAAPSTVVVTDTGTSPPAPALLALLSAQSAALAALSAQITALAARPSILDEGTLP